MSDSDDDQNYSVVEYIKDHNGNRCGYCKSESTNFSHGMWAHRLAVSDYQDLIDRGWRRSGRYCYKPTMSQTCCPQYTIRCDTLNFKVSKSQKKVLKRMHAYLSNGEQRKSQSECEGNGSAEMHEPSHTPEHRRVSKSTLEDDVKVSVYGLKKNRKVPSSSTDPSLSSCSNTPKPEKMDTANNTPKAKVNPGVGRDPSKPPCKKAKLARREKLLSKMAARGKASPQAEKSHGHDTGQGKTLEDFFNAPMPASPAHRLELRLSRSRLFEPDLMKSLDASFDVYAKYQMGVHGDPPHECNENTFKNFLVDAPLLPWEPHGGPPLGFGPFHQQYWLDGQLIAVGVIDVLPNSISSVYLYYDPEFSFLSLGVYSTLREIAFTRELNRQVPSLRWYYLGFYIHSCPKMRYKGNYNPSYLLCPETYSWVPLEKCVPKLNLSKYSRLNHDVAIREPNFNTSLVLCLYHGQPHLYQEVRLMRRPSRNTDEEEVRQYLSLAGFKAATSILLYRR